MTKKELYQALEAAKRNTPVISESFQCYKDDLYKEKFNGINLSSLFTLLIREAARLTDYYTSDIFYDLENLNNDLKGDNTVLFNQESYQTVIGIREAGTDHESFVLSREAGNHTFACIYRAIYYIKVTPEANHYKKLECFKIDPNDLDYYFKRKPVWEAVNNNGGITA